MINSARLQCYACKSMLPLTELAWRCACGGQLDVVGTAMFSRDQLAERPHSFWRYSEALACTVNPRVTLGEVMTPLLEVNFREWRVTLKLEYVLPTGSYKDRGVAVAINHLLSLGVTSISEDSSGNAGASTAAYAAAAGILASIYTPHTTSPSKVHQVSMYGATCHLIPGNRSDSAQKAKESNALYIGHSWNPFFACGIKSIAYEIAEQYRWSVPDWVVTPAGGGSLVLGLIDGFKELLQAGFVTRLPKLLVVQAAACAPIYDGWIKHTSVSPAKLHATLAEGVALPDPSRGNQVVDAIREYNAEVVQVDEEELWQCWTDMARIGVFCEPTSALAVAGAWTARTKTGLIGPEEKVVVVITGHGLKSKGSLVENAMKV